MGYQTTSYPDAERQRHDTKTSTGMQGQNPTVMSQVCDHPSQELSWVCGGFRRFVAVSVGSPIAVSRVVDYYVFGYQTTSCPRHDQGEPLTRGSPFSLPMRSSGPNGLPLEDALHGGDVEASTLSRRPPGRVHRLDDRPDRPALTP